MPLHCQKDVIKILFKVSLECFIPPHHLLFKKQINQKVVNFSTSGHSTKTAGARYKIHSRLQVTCKLNKYQVYHQIEGTTEKDISNKRLHDTTIHLHG